MDGNINSTIAKSGFYNKFEEISIDISTEDRDSWSDNQLKVNDSSFARRNLFWIFKASVYNY